MRRTRELLGGMTEVEDMESIARTLTGKIIISIMAQNTNLRYEIRLKNCTTLKSGLITFAYRKPKEMLKRRACLIHMHMSLC